MVTYINKRPLKADGLELVDPAFVGQNHSYSPKDLF